MIPTHTHTPTCPQDRAWFNAQLFVVEQEACERYVDAQVSEMEAEALREDAATHASEKEELQRWSAEVKKKLAGAGLEDERSDRTPRFSGANASVT